ncbi:MAG: peptide chain release factor 2 [Coriobacteriia bacterium]|nr:peptide chain release factor 2 [Coriobacteriia bacterium]
MSERDLKTIDELAERVKDAHAFLHIDQKTIRLADLDRECAAPGFWDDAAHATAVSKDASILRDVIAQYDRAVGLLDDARAALELAGEDPDFAEEAEAEAAELLDALEPLLDELEISSWFTGEFDEGDAIVSINPGQGGLEAQDWAEMLFKMLTRYCESKGWKVHVLETVAGEGIGLDRASFQVEGHNAYGMLRSENGVHRLVRISPTDLKGRRQTTFGAVEVLPVLPDTVEVDLDPNDIRVDVYRSSGPGGQCVNTTDSAVRLTHLPTGIVVTCQNQKSQLQNKDAAMRVLRARLYELEEKKRAAQVDELRGDQMANSFGSQIRNYVLYPYQMVKDVRSGVETSNVDAVLGGDLEQFVIGYHKWHVSQ